MGKGGTCVNVYSLSRGINRLRRARDGTREESVAKITTYVHFCISSVGPQAAPEGGAYVPALFVGMYASIFPRPQWN